VMVSLLPRSTAAAASASAAEGEAPVVLDPACGTGTLLSAVADRFGSQVRLAGQEIREDGAAAAALSLRGHPHDVSYEIHAGDSLLHSQLGGYLGAAAAVVCEPPFDLPQWPAGQLSADPRWAFGVPATRDSELAWVQHCYAHLRPRGVAVVAVSSRTCVQPSGQDVRAALVRGGALRDVIALPSGLSTVPGNDVCLWVLRRPYGAPERDTVALVDLSGSVDPADVPREFAAWERLFRDADTTICRAVPRRELLDSHVSLLPSRHLAARGVPSAGDLARVTDRLRDLYASIGPVLPRFGAPAVPARRAHVTLGELERAGALTIRSRDTTPRPGDVLLRTLGRAPVVATGAAAQDHGIAQVIEIDPARLDPDFVATFLRADAGALPLANTLGALSRDDLRRCRVPRMPLARQRQYGAEFRRLGELADTLAALSRVSASVIDQAVHGLTTGALAPGGPRRRDVSDTHASTATAEMRKT
ncbi:MAG: HsdM family class I SAM-dependent methyltransferase, partial [Streptosporangiaceae bacterium]